MDEKLKLVTLSNFIGDIKAKQLIKILNTEDAEIANEFNTYVVDMLKVNNHNYSKSFYIEYLFDLVVKKNTDDMLPYKIWLIDNKILLDVKK